MKRKIAFKWLGIILGLSLIVGVSYLYAWTDLGTGGWDYTNNTHYWFYQEDGDYVPGTDSTVDIGASGTEVANLYVESITLGGTAKTSWGSVVSPMTDASGYVYPTDSGGVYRLYDAGYLSLGAGTAIDVYILFDTDDDDFYFGRDDTDNDCAWGVGSTLGTDERITVVDDATLTHIVIGDNADLEDKYIIFDGNATDQYLGYLDTYDMVCMGDGSTMDADMAFGIENASTPKLVLWNGIDGYGAIDLDYGSADITDHTFVSDGGTLVIDGTITLTSLDIISNATDDTIRVASEDLDTVLEIYSPYVTNGDATLQFTADADTDAGDRMAIVHDGATNSMFFQSDTASADTLATILTLAKTGVITTTAAINVEIDDSANTTVTDVVNIQHFTSGTAGAGIGAGLTFDLENAVGTEEEHASIDAVAVTSTDGSEATDVVVNQMTAGALAETLRLVALSSATTSDYLQFTGNTTETNGLHNIMVLKSATGTAADNYGFSISFQPEDATGAEEKARIDILQTTAARATNDTDFVFTQDVNGTLTETFRLNADSNNTMNSGLTTASATDASSLTAGSIVTAGGIACAKQLYVGDDIDMSVSGTGVYDITLKTNVADALSITDGTDILVFETTTGAPTVTITPATTVTGTLTATGAIVANGAVTLGNAATDVITVTGKVAGATPLSFDGVTADAVYTILAVDDAASASKTVTLPSVTGTIKLTGTAVALTPAAAVTLTVAKGTTLYTDTVTDNEDQAITFSGAGAAGDEVTIIFTTAGIADEVITFHATLVSSEGTLTLGTTAARYYVVRFISDGAHWYEVSRTAVQT